MPAAVFSSDAKKHDELIAFISALLIVQFLFFIDEGYYDFRWMQEWGNWIVFVFYLVIIFPVQWLLAKFLFVRFHGMTKVWMMLFMGIPLTVLLSIWIFA